MKEKIPNSETTEKAIIGSILIDNDIINNVISIIKPEMFYYTNNSNIFKIILSLFESGEKSDTISVSARIDTDKISENYIYECANSVTSSANISTYCRHLLELYIQRVLLNISNTITKKIYDQSNTALEVAKEAENTLYNIIKYKTNAKTISEKEIPITYINILKNRFNTKYVTSGIESIDAKLVAGFTLKNVSVIAGAPGNLKSTLRSNLEISMCKQGEGVITIATEQDEETELDRKICCITQIPFHLLHHPKNLTSEQYKQIQETTNYIREEWNYNLVTNRGLSIAGLRQEIDRILSRGKNKRIVFIDLFDRLKDVRVAENKAQNISMHLATINEMAQEFNLHFCLLVQMNREFKKTKSKKPKIHYIKDSASYEEVSRLIFLLHRPSLYVESSGYEDDKLEVNIAKQNNGAAGASVNIEFVFDWQHFKLNEISNIEFE